MYFVKVMIWFAGACIVLPSILYALEYLDKEKKMNVFLGCMDLKNFPASEVFSSEESLVFIFKTNASEKNFRCSPCKADQKCRLAYKNGLFYIKTLDNKLLAHNRKRSSVNLVAVNLDRDRLYLRIFEEYWRSGRKVRVGREKSYNFIIDSVCCNKKDQDKLMKFLKKDGETV